MTVNELKRLETEEQSKVVMDLIMQEFRNVEDDLRFIKQCKVKEITYIYEDKNDKYYAMIKNKFKSRKIKLYNFHMSHERYLVKENFHEKLNRIREDLLELIDDVQTDIGLGDFYLGSGLLRDLLRNQIISLDKTDPICYNLL